MGMFGGREQDEFDFVFALDMRIVTRRNFEKVARRDVRLGAAIHHAHDHAPRAVSGAMSA